MKQETPSRVISGDLVGRNEWAPYLFLSPFLIVFAVFMALPMFNSAFLALSQTYGPNYSNYVGLKNFSILIHDREFWLAVSNTAIYAMVSVAIQLPLSLLLALLLNRPSLKGRLFFRLVFFSPSLVGVVFVAIMFGVMLGEREGVVNAILRSIFPHFPAEFPWLQKYVMASLVLASLWMYVGYNMVYLLAALQTVNRDATEAARIDGANSWQVFLHVILPEIKPVLTFVILLSIIGSLQLFELPYILFGGPGPEKKGLTVVMYLYQNGFEHSDLGLASAIGWVLAVFLMILAILQRKVTQHVH